MTNIYQGFEQGPIRPPSEAKSLLIRVTRNCHWNRCTFCPVYKGSRFSIRPLEHVMADLDAVARHLESLSLISAGDAVLMQEDVDQLFATLAPDDRPSFRAALNWFVAGRASLFLQDADSLVGKPERILRILERIRSLFPTVKRVTAYSRSDTLDRLHMGELQAFRNAGLTRVHVGMESGSDQVLEMVCKGVPREVHVRAGLKVKGAGMELSEYYMPGLGGVDLYRENGLETAGAVSMINPDFLRLRTLAIPDRAPIAGELHAGRFRKGNDILVAEEILLFLENLRGCDGYLASDHILNLLPEVEGYLDRDLEWMKAVIRSFLDLEPELQTLYRLGRRLGIFSCLAEIDDPGKRMAACEACARLGVTTENCDHCIDELMKRFI